MFNKHFSYPDWKALKRNMAQKSAQPPTQQQALLLDGGRGPFGRTAFLGMVAVTTLLLQCISFASTWQGATVYLAGIFALAPLFFAVAVQAAAYFLANAMRHKITAPRTLALVLALCCSTYYSYIGIYNHVQPPASYLAGRYAQVRSTLASQIGGAQGDLLQQAQSGTAALLDELTQQYSQMQSQAAALQAAAAQLEQAGAGYAGKMQAPHPSAYADYNDYLAAYSAYLAGVTQGSTAEQAAARAQILQQAGYATEADLAAARAQVAAQMEKLTAGLEALAPGQQGAAAQIEVARAQLAAALTKAAGGGSLSEQEQAAFTRLAALAGGDARQLLAPVEKLAADAQVAGMATLDELVAALPGGRATDANAMQLKADMDGQIRQAVVRYNALAPARPLAADSPELAITPLYLLPAANLLQPGTRGMAAFCLAIAALIDGLTLVFSFACRRPKSLLRARTRRAVLAQNGQLLAQQVYACLPQGEPPIAALRRFLGCFAPWPQGTAKGYALAAPIEALGEWGLLVALLCQLKLACLNGGRLLLHSRFLYWAGELAARQSAQELEAQLAAQKAQQPRPAPAPAQG